MILETVYDCGEGKMSNNSAFEEGGLCMKG